ncbi:MAG: ribosome-associated translation inhibitor RaiA [Gammaproteobacteria bacterium]|nr:ribosome-associated translation inhibitor RaiA [Gammaproteobacteria bacterium]
MQVPVQITFRGLTHSDAVKTHIDERIDKLQQYCDSIIACHVVVEYENKNQNRGNLHNTRLTLTIPGKELVSTHNDDEDMYVSIRTAFDDMTRQLESHVELLQEHVKNNQTLLSGKVIRLFDDFGFIEGNDGNEFYFNAKHVAHPVFDKLTVGASVHFIESTGTSGPEARHVKITG